MKVTHKLKLLLIISSLSSALAIAPAPAFSQHQAQQTAKTQNPVEIKDRIIELIDQEKFASARWGIRIITKDGQPVFERDADKTFIPASNMKLYTSAVTLDALGPDYRIKTSVYATRRIARGGVLRGDLIFYGRGDPNLSSRFENGDSQNYDELIPSDIVPAIEQLADRIKKRGIRVITGNLIGDDSYFSGDPLGPGWEWDDFQFYYGSEVSALTVNDNVIHFTVTPGHRIDDPPVITTKPITGYVQIINNAKTVAYGATRIGVHRPLNSNTVEFFGTIPRNAKEFKIYIAIHDPASYAATLLKDALERRKIRVRGKVRRLDSIARLEDPFNPSKLIEVATIESQPLSEMIKVINKQSQNLHTELMLRLLGTCHKEAGTLDDYGHPKSSAELGNEIREEFLKKIGVDFQTLSLRDGSGLSRKNLVTPRSTTRLLEFMLTHPHFNTFHDSLVIAGIDGTLQRRMRSSLAANNFRGKTGTLSFASALSGYLTTKNGQMLILSIMGNNYTGPGRDVTSVIDQICTMLAEYDGQLPGEITK